MSALGKRVRVWSRVPGWSSPGGIGIVEKLRVFPLDVLTPHREGTTFIYEKSKSFVEGGRWDLWEQELLAHCLAGV